LIWFDGYGEAICLRELTNLAFLGKDSAFLRKGEKRGEKGEVDGTSEEYLSAVAGRG
jgi:hypothetical protein